MVPWRMMPTKPRLTAETSSYVETSLFIEIGARERQGTSRKRLLCGKMPLSEESGIKKRQVSGRNKFLQIEIGCYGVISLV